MTKMIWHYAHRYHGGLFSGRRELELPAGAQPLNVHYEDDVVGIWVLLDPAERASQPWVILGVRMNEKFNVPRESTPHYLGVAEQDGPNTIHYYAFRQKGEPCLS